MQLNAKIMIVLYDVFVSVKLVWHSSSRGRLVSSTQQEVPVQVPVL